MKNAYCKIRVLIADDHELVREGLQVMLKKIDEIELVGEVTNGEELILQTRLLSPDVILTDVKMPGMDGREATRKIKNEFPHIGVIALSSFDEEDLIMDMLSAGAKGYLLKNAGKKELTDAVKAAYKDEPYYCVHTNMKLSQMISRGSKSFGNKKTAESFTERELEVIKFICEGLTSKEIASKLQLKTRTVERYRDSIMEKMEVRNAAGVVLYAVQHGICSSSAQKNL
jgi:DNA-binding NarL/FixJ family response regulator